MLWFSFYGFRARASRCGHIANWTLHPPPDFEHWVWIFPATVPWSETITWWVSTWNLISSFLACFM
jgi:hypothetical protein